MSEFINNGASRLEALAGFTRGMIEHGDGKTLIDKYQSVLDTVTPTETMMVLDQMLTEGFSNETVKTNLGKILNVFFKSLSAHRWEKPDEHHFLSCLMSENRAVAVIMTDIKAVIKALFSTENPNEAKLFDDLRLLIVQLKLYDLHYVKKENILFPYIEKAFPQYRCLQLMWSFHDDFRRSIKNIETILADTNPDKQSLNRELGRLFFVVLPIVFREEQIVFPVAYKAIPQKGWEDMMHQSFEIGWCYIAPPSKILHGDNSGADWSGKVNLGTGFLTPEQLTLLFNNLPVDITFVDENDEVCYFSGVKHRIFPRSKAIIGRKVQNCHPPESVHIVNDIIDAFRSGQKDHADFWIQMKGRFIHIRYFAVRNEAGAYKGTIEVSQDVTEIRGLQGEQRLLAWNRG
jgi:DUF438 domain-containing protein